ncbi:MAG: Flp pilus assembly protein CpaB [Burkholderiaceae bacterium]
MRNLKAFVLLFAALALGLAAAVYAAGWVSRQGQVAANKVVVAAADIELGSRVNPQMLTLVDWPAGAVPPGAFQNVKELQDRVVRVSLLRGEPVLEPKLAPVGTMGGLSAVIAEGKRAMTVRVNDVVGVAGFALPGNYVDVLVNAQQERGKDGNSRQITKTVLEHVLVLAVAQEAGRDDTKPKVVSAVTLELSLEDSEKLDLARSVGTLSLVLRNQIDKRMVSTDGITKTQLFGEHEEIMPEKLVAPQKPRIVTARAAPIPATTCVEVIQNGIRAMNCF